MFSDNKRISYRQIFRLFVFELLGASTLILPGYLSEQGGLCGCISVIVGTLFSLLFLLLLYRAMKIMKCDLITFLSKISQRKMQEKAISKITIILLFFYGIMISGIYLYVFSELININLLPDEKYTIISGIIILTSAYAVSGSLENRARVYEILFLFVLILLLALTVFSVKNIKFEYLMPNLTSWVLNLDLLKKCIKNTYLVFASYTTLFCLLFIPQQGKRGIYQHTGRLCKTICVSLLISSAVLLILYLDLIGNFGSGALSQMRFPIVTLIGTISRIDSFMLTVWFFTLFALLNMHQYYSGKLLKNITGNNGRRRYIAAVAFVTYAVSIVLKYGDDIMNRYLKVLLYVGVPMLVLIPVVIILTGCRSDQLEDRCFPMLAAVDMNKEGEVTFEYRFPRVEGNEVKEISRGSYDFEQALETYEESLSKEPDTNHLKVIIIGEAFIGDRMQYDYFIEELREQELFPRNTYVCISRNVDNILEYENEISMDIGGYIEEYLNKNSKSKNMQLVTLGELMDESVNKRLTLYIPVLEVSEDGIAWNSNYEIVNGIPFGDK